MILELVFAVLSAAFCVGILFLIIIALNKLSKRENASSSEIVILEDKTIKLLPPKKPAIRLNQDGLSLNRAFVRCRATKHDVEKLFDYRGSQDCRSLMNTFTGDRACPWACLGKGDCSIVCTEKAISIVDGLARIASFCNGCGSCINVCPIKIIELVPREADYLIPCSSHAGEATSSNCSLGCTGCSKCEYAGAYAGYYVRNNLASIDYRKIGSRSIGAETCPSRCILKAEDYFSTFVEK